VYTYLLHALLHWFKTSFAFATKPLCGPGHDEVKPQDALDQSPNGLRQLLPYPPPILPGLRHSAPDSFIL